VHIAVFGPAQVAVLDDGARRDEAYDAGADPVRRVVDDQAPADRDLDEHATVLAVELEGELDLYEGDGRI
jgi:alpha-L-fucosidase